MLNAEVSFFNVTTRPSVLPEPASVAEPPKKTKLDDYNKLRGSHRVKAQETLKEIFHELPSLKDQQEASKKKIEEKIRSIDEIMRILGPDAENLPSDILGDVNLLIMKPEVVAASLLEAEKEYNSKSPIRKEKQTLPDNLGSRLKTSTSLNRTNTRNISTTSSNVSSTSMKSNNGRPPARVNSKKSAQATPLSNRVAAKKKLGK